VDPGERGGVLDDGGSDLDHGSDCRSQSFAPALASPDPEFDPDPAIATMLRGMLR
jgi:hypothetical protein